jgi:tetratricopeptide (TPR) repeat protein
MRAARLALVAIALAVPAHADPAADRFREANDLVRAGDYPKAIALYQEIASSGQESASLYWNWAQAAAARGGQGEALWALLRARELDPGDRAVGRDVQRLREALNLDPAEIAPEPLSAVGRFARRFRLDLVALALLALSVLAHVLVRLGVGRRVAGRVAGSALALGLLVAVVPLAASFARPTAAVVRRGAPLLDSASPTAEPTGALREGEVVPVLESSGEWVRVEDNAGARGWAHVADARRLDVPPPPAPARE